MRSAQGGLDDRATWAAVNGGTADPNPFRAQPIHIEKVVVLLVCDDDAAGKRVCWKWTRHDLDGDRAAMSQPFGHLALSHPRACYHGHDVRSRARQTQRRHMG